MQHARGISGMLCYWTAVKMNKYCNTHSYVFNSDSIKDFYLEICGNIYSKKLCVCVCVCVYIYIYIYVCMYIYIQNLIW